MPADLLPQQLRPLREWKRYIPNAGYNTDYSKGPTPPKATFLLAKQLLETGDDTQFVNMTLAYEDLPLDIKKRIDRRKAKHVSQSKFSARKLTGLTPEAKKYVPDFVMHPYPHPSRDGPENFYVNQVRIEAIEGLEEAENLELLDALSDHAT